MYMTSHEDEVNLDKEYSPSQNTKRFQDHPKPHDEVIKNFIEVTKRDTIKARLKYQIRENVCYGKEKSDDRQLLDIYYKGNEEKTPIFVFIHGGFWQSLDKSSSGSFVAPLVENNNRVIVMDYNLCPSVTLKQLIEQTQDFFDWIFNYATLTKASYISFCGHSAGAHLAVSLLYSAKFQNFSEAVRIHSFFLISGVYDLRELWNLHCVNPNNILSLNLTDATTVSPVCTNLSKEAIECCRQNKTKLHILVAENDSETFIGQSREFCNHLTHLGLEAYFKIFEVYDHFDIIEEAALETSAISRYVTKHNCI